MFDDDNMWKINRREDAEYNTLKETRIQQKRSRCIAYTEDVCLYVVYFNTVMQR